MAALLTLVIEPDAIQSKLVSFLLEAAGHTVHIAESAERAYEVLSRLLPDLMLTELELPGEDGLKLARELRLNPVYDAVKIIALTACTHPGDLIQAREAGCIGMISKPIDPPAFAYQVQKYLAGIPGSNADVLSGQGDLLAEARNHFLGEGLFQCDAILKELGANPDSAIVRVHRSLACWTASAAPLGFPVLYEQARALHSGITSNRLSLEAAISAIESLRRRIGAATREEPKLPPAVAAALRNREIGLVNFTGEETDRLRIAAKRADIDVTFRPMAMEHEAGEDQTKPDALIVNACALRGDTAPHLPRAPIPAIFIGARSSLEALSKLPAGALDFVIAPWDAEELLVRAYRLLVKPTPQLTKEPAPKKRPCVLIADDDQDLVSLVSATLGPAGMQCAIAHSGAQALESIRQQPPDAVILDVNLAGMDGFEVLKRLRRDPATETLPVLMLTGRKRGADIALGIGFGANDYVVKPFDPSDLIARVGKIMAASRKLVTRS